MRRIGMAVLGLAIVGSNLYGQRSALREVHDRGTFGVTLAVAEPLGEFRNNANLAGGITGYALTGGRTLGLRIEGSWILYASDYQGYDFSTTSQIGTLAAGPQLTLGTGPIRFYGFATIGGSLFWSSAHSGCGCYRGDYYLDGDLTTTTSGGGGVQIAVSQRRTPVFIDFGVAKPRRLVQRAARRDAGGPACMANRGVDRDSVTSPAVPRLTPNPLSTLWRGGLFLRRWVFFQDLIQVTLRAS